MSAISLHRIVRLPAVCTARFAMLVLSAALAVWLMALPAQSSADAPAWSRGMQLLHIKVSEASHRADLALKAEGYNVTDHSNPSEDSYFVGGQKGNHSAIIMCDKAPGNSGTWVNIVVATGDTGDGGVPGLERQHLQARMDKPGSPSPSGGIAGVWAYHDNDSNYSNTQTFGADGTITADGIHATWKHEGNDLVTRWENGWSNRFPWSPTANKLTGTAYGPNGEKHAITLTRQ